MCAPPLTWIVWPVSHCASGLESSATTPATSSGNPTLPSGLEPDILASISSMVILSPPGMYSFAATAYMSLFTPPGATALTVIFRGPKSQARHFTMPVTAALDAL